MRKEIWVIVGTLLLLHATVHRGDAAAPRAFVEANEALLWGPKPEYPFEARSRRQEGSCVAIMDLDPSTGHVTNVQLAESTGHEILDRAVLDRLHEWRFKPGIRGAKVPITFGPGGKVITTISVKKSESMSEILAPILGKGTIIDGPNPTYPLSPPWTDKQGKGVYELHVGKDGKVENVKILKSSGDETFDRITVSTLGRWRLRKGPLVVELPLGFRMTSKTYDVYIP